MKGLRFSKSLTAAALLALLAVPILGPVAAMGQTANSGVITGVVKDPSGAVVADAIVKAIHKATGVERKTTSSSTGSYEITQLVPGDYRLEIEAKGFAKVVVDPVTVNVLQ